MAFQVAGISVIVATYRREHVLVATLDHLLRQVEPSDELLVVDQTEHHAPATDAYLQQLESSRAIRLIRQYPASITAAMNRGLLEARRDAVLFVDDDVVPERSLVSVHRDAHRTNEMTIVAGRIVQPWDIGRPRTPAFAAVEPRWLDEFMGGNFSVQRDHALKIGGFDENFVRVAYKYEAEFAYRFRAAGGRIRFEPAACVHHLHAARGGTRSYGEHLRTANPAHAVGAYYFSLRTHPPLQSLREWVRRPFGAIATRHHLRRPWWIPMTLAAEVRGMLWATRLHLSGPKLIESSTHVS